MRPIRLSLLSLLAALTAGCLQHHLVHPRRVPPGVATWAASREAGDLLVRMEGAAPGGSGPFPCVLVHPEAGHPATHMLGVVWDLASRGYLAAAADYRRRIDGRWRKSLFPWREIGDGRAALDLLLSDPRCDAGRLGALGFSQGGIFSLHAAALEPSVRAVVAYYPVTDFHAWLDTPWENAGRRHFFKMIRRYFRKKSGAATDEEFDDLLREASPMTHADAIRAPVLLIHGERDLSASPEESRRLAERLQALGREARVVIVPGVGHVFNFKRRHRAEAEEAWRETLGWLERHLAPGDPPPR